MGIAQSVESISSKPSRNHRHLAYENKYECGTFVVRHLLRTLLNGDQTQSPQQDFECDSKRHLCRQSLQSKKNTSLPHRTGYFAAVFFVNFLGDIVNTRPKSPRRGSFVPCSYRLQ